MGGGLIVFPSTYRAGKSTLIAALAASGVRTHADDLMPLTQGEGVALGINPRLRRPLPANAPDRLLMFVARHAGPRDRRYQYLDLPAPLLSPHGERRPILRANLLFRGVEIGPGRHRVEFHFRPMSLENLVAAASDLVESEEEPIKTAIASPLQ